MSINTYSILRCGANVARWEVFVPSQLTNWSVCSKWWQSKST